MTGRILVLGGYGNFGSLICRGLASDPNVTLLVGGRSLERAAAFAATLGAANPPEPLAVDIDSGLPPALASARPDILVHTVGPFQGQDCRVPEACIEAGVHYIDLADGRAFVGRICTLDEKARSAGVAVISGASTVPCLSAAVLDHFSDRFARLEKLDYGITTAQAALPGVATVAGVLSYAGKSFPTLLGTGDEVDLHGWQDLRIVAYPELGSRLFGNCEIPDLDLFPGRYPGLDWIRFGAGHELAALNLGTCALSWLVRAGLVDSADRWAPQLRNLARSFGRFGSGKGGMHMFMSGTGRDGQPKEVRFFLIARSGDGPNIPCIPAILLARRLAHGERLEPGARPCLDLVDLADWRSALERFDVSLVVEGDDG